MRIVVDQIPQEGLTLEQSLRGEELNLEAKEIKFIGPIKAKALVNKITNVVTVDLELRAVINFICSRCLEKADLALNRNLKLNYTISHNQDSLELDEDIRQELMLDYPVKPLCKLSCKGLCPVCGENLNLGHCKCTS